jgi:ribosomal protein S18 acetylase RimI-like enzyme
MMSAVPKIRLLQPIEQSQAVRVLTDAYADDIVYSHFFDVPDAMLQNMSRVWNFLITYTLNNGEAYTSSNLEGVASWLPPDHTNLEFARVLGTGRAGLQLLNGIVRLSPRARRNASIFMGIMDELHNDIRQPHWYLWNLAVHPDHQGKGIGTALVRDMFSRTEQEGYGIYLETQNPRNVGYYEQLGFVVLREVTVPNLDFEARLWSMWREPQA